ncbi:DUF6443 domain-containing protein [Flavobacterium sp. J27]|uniref:DUF6443 domain-containing protein n=1 Tax=Flavobacterium sp. J27 TaxID=2060419 RepID=UPI0013EE57E3|nr:DUF6443 domain-containing protein [Flavobacterium sp. J27]
MKKLLYIAMLIPFLALGQSQDQNYIKNTTYKKPTSQGTVDVTNPAEAMVQVSYFDGLGRPIQQIAHKQSNSGKDIITHIEYDSFGRQTKEYLPYPNTTASLDYTDPTTVVSDLTGFYGSYNGGTTNPFSQKELETSPLNRVLKQAAPGDAWAMGQGKEIKFDYQTNTASEVKLFKAIATWDASAELYNINISSPQTYYDAGQLYKTITKDENWTSGLNHTTEEFKNKEGQVVLKRAYNNGDAHDTYYVYDIRGNLTYVMPPLAEGDSSQSTLDNLGYQYKYDARNRLVEKKLPGKQWEFIVYDKLDRPVATGPAYNVYGAVDENDIGWMITEYDVFGRVTQTGWKQLTVSATTRASNQSSVTSGSNPFVLSANDILTKNYYDDYTYPNAPTPLPTQVEGQNVVTNVKGLPTGTWTKVLDANNANAAETSYTLYDTYYRPVRTYTSNYVGGYTQVNSKLDWAGKTEYTVTTHKYDTNGTVVTVKDIFKYTAQDRLELHTQQINGGNEQLLAKNTYDELGQLTSKNVGGTDASGATGLQSVDYSYNIRGWLKGINDIYNLSSDLFAFKINYNDAETATNLFNGNISETFWNSNSDGGFIRKYIYNYDDLNRLHYGVYLKPQAAFNEANGYNETISYDKNGNIQTLIRTGGFVAQTIQYIDNLTYTYDPDKKNQLLKVEDHTTSPQGFKDGVNAGNDYEYDANGNMTKDDNKGITNIVYNHLNLPTEILFGTNKIEYLYNAVGQKVVKKVTENSVVTTTTYLGGGFQYENSVLQFFPHAEGYVKQHLGAYSYVFNYTDHLGNIRLSYSDIDGNGILGDEYVQECFTQTGRDGSPQTFCNDYFISPILEESHYYPFGLKHQGYNTDSTQPNYNYKYNGKELQTELGLNMYDYGARNYDPALGRYFTIDNFSEAFYNINPYQYTANNPVKFIDVNGDFIYISDGNGNNYRYNNGRIYSKTEGSDDDWNEYIPEEGSYVAQIVQALHDITQDDENSFGSQFLSLFENQELNAIFTENTLDNRTVTTGRNIKTSDKQNELVATTKGNEKLIFHITIAHELAHVIENTLYDEKVLGAKWFSITTKNARKDISVGEIFASTFENMIRAEQGLPLRTHYSINDDGSVVGDSRLIKKSKIKNPFYKQYESTEEVLEIWNKIIKARKQ